jgi:hypothetical protein
MRRHREAPESATAGLGGPARKTPSMREREQGAVKTAQAHARISGQHDEGRRRQPAGRPASPTEEAGV